MTRLLIILLFLPYQLMAQKYLLSKDPVAPYNATKYYVSNSGNDANDGHRTSSSWQTIAKVSATALNPGDTVFFKSGDTWREQLTINRASATSRIVKDRLDTAQFTANASPSTLTTTVGSADNEYLIVMIGDAFSDATYHIDSVVVDGVGGAKLDSLVAYRWAETGKASRLYGIKGVQAGTRTISVYSSTAFTGIIASLSLFHVGGFVAGTANLGYGYGTSLHLAATKAETEWIIAAASKNSSVSFSVPAAQTLLFSSGNSTGGALCYNSSATSDSVRWTVSSAAESYMTSVNLSSEDSSDTRPIVYASYGTGNKPLIEGREVLTGWTVYSGSIYQAQASATIKDLYANNVQMTIARTPNNGFLGGWVVGASPSLTKITSISLTQANNYWTGGTFRTRSSDFTYSNATITGSYDTGDSITFTSTTPYSATEGWGFYCDGVLAALDSAGEWYCDPATKIVYFYAPDGVDPSTMTVLGSNSDYGVVNNGKNYITLNGLDIRGQSVAAVYSPLKLIGNTITGCNIQYGMGSGIYFNPLNGVYPDSNKSITVTSNTISDLNGTGVFIRGLRDGNVSSNTIRRCGIVPGYGISGVGGEGIQIYTMTTSGSATRIFPTDNMIQLNVIDSVGYAGITSEGHRSHVQYNYLDHWMLTLGDGGGIYSYSGSSTTPYSRDQHWLRNILLNGYGSNLGKPSGTVYAEGLYLDGLAEQGFRLDSNTVAYSNGHGHFLQGSAFNDTIYANVFYDLARIDDNGTYIYLYQDTTYNYGGLYVVKNQLAIHGAGLGALVSLQDNSHISPHNYGVIDSNTYFNPYNHANPFKALAHLGSWAWSNYTFAQWQTYINGDSHSVQEWKTWGAGTCPDSLFYNTTNVNKVFTLTGTWHDVNNTLISSPLTLKPFTSMILIHE
jgi:hypothetical protein